MLEFIFGIVTTLVIEFILLVIYTAKIYGGNK